MKQILCTAALTIAASVFMSTAAQAGSCANLSRSACAAAKAAQAAAPYKGPMAKTRQKMACVRVVSYGRTEVIWVPAGERNYVHTQPLTKQNRSAGYAERFSLNPGWVVTESCVPQAWLRNVRKLTICNGAQVGQGYHWEVSASTLRALKGQRGEPGVYTPLLSEKDKRSLSPQQVKAAYAARYYR